MRMFLDYCPVPDKLLYTTCPIVQLPVMIKEFVPDVFQRFKTVIIETQEYRYFIDNKWISQFIAYEFESRTIVIYKGKNELKTHLRHR